MALRKQVDRKRKELEKKIEVYKKNSKALCDMLALYSYFIEEGKDLDPAGYIALEAMVKDLEDKDVNVSFKAKSIEELMQQDSDNYYKVLRELKESDYYNELEDKLQEDYRVIPTRQYYRTHYVKYNNEELFKQPFNFWIRMCRYYYGGSSLISEFLVSNMDMSKKVNILYEIIKYYIKTHSYINSFEYILDSKGAGYELSRTKYNVKEEKINELIIAFKEEIDTNEDKKTELFDIIYKIVRDNIGENTTCIAQTVGWVCYLQEKKLVDFMSIRNKHYIGDNLEEVSLCPFLGVQHLENFKKFYQLEDYNNLPENIRANDNILILDCLAIKDIPSFIALTNYKTSIVDIERIGKRIIRLQRLGQEINKELIEQIKSAIIHKAKDKEEYKTYCELAKMFERISDYSAYKKEREKETEERKRLKAQEERKLLNARYELILRLYNMNESLQEQVPGKKVIKDLVFQKEGNPKN